MPGSSGLDLQDALADRECTIPIIFITGHGNVATSVRAMKAGALVHSDFALKNVTLEEDLERYLPIVMVAVCGRRTIPIKVPRSILRFRSREHNHQV